MALISTTGPICPNVTDTPLDNRSRVSTIAGIGNIPLAWRGMLVYCEENGKIYKVTSLKPKRSGPVEIENYYPATWVEFGSGGSTPSPTPYGIDAGDVSYFSSGTFSNNTVGKELQSLANDILGLTEDIHNLSGDIGTLSSLDTDYQQDLVGAINEVLGITDDKVAGIKVQGESSVLPMDGNGIVTIPTGGGSGTITGATVGGSQVPEVGGILQFQAYPTVPITGIKDANGNSLNPNNGIVTLPPIPGNNQPIVIPPSAVELPVSTSNPNYIDYDSDTTYVMNIDGTQVATIHYPYVDNSNNYVAFKAIDRDLYYVYSVSIVNDAERYTYSNQYTWSTLPAEAKSKFESGIYAIKQVINDDGTLPEKKWYKNIPSAFVDKNNFPLRTRRIDETVSSSVIDVLLVKNDRLNKIYRYAFNTISNAWVLVNGGCYTKDDATTGENYTKYDAYFDRQSASNVSFDDSITKLGTQQNPVTDVQTAINILTTAIASNICITKVILKDYDGAFINNTSVYVSYVLNGETVVISSSTNPTLTTDANGEVTCNIPYGATYTISFIDKSDRQKPTDITLIAENAHITHQVLYSLQANVEQINLQVQVRGANNASSQFDLTDRIVYIDYLNSNYEVTVQNAMTCYLNARGNIVRVVDINNVETDTCLIPRGTIYKIRLSEWTNMVSSGDKIYTANRFTRSLVMYYSYTLSGLFIVIENYDINGNDLDTYTEYKCIDYDYNNNIVTVKDSEDNQWDVKYDSTEGILHSPHGTNTWGVWIDNSNLNRVLGIGVRSSATINHDIFDDTGATGYTDCSFILTNNSRTNSIWQNSNTSWPSHPADLYSGRHNTNFMAISTEPQSLVAKEAIARTLKTGNIVQTGFILAPYQARQLYLNKQDILLLTNILHFTNNIQEAWINTIPTSVEKGDASGRDYWAEASGSMSQSVTMKSNSVQTFVCFSF